jgi:site-specific recombinase XerD
MRRDRPSKSNQLLPKPAQLPVLGLDEAIDAAATYAKGSRSAATWRAYEADWRSFQAWCRHVRLDPLPATPHTVALFLSAQAKRGRAPATLGRRLAAIRLMHVGARHPSPHDAIEVAEVMRGIRRAWKKPAAQKAPAVDEEVKRMVDAVDPQTLHGLRDRALLLLGFAGAFRRSELVGLDVDHLTERKEGLAVLIATSKTDQEGAGQMIAIARVPHSDYCPVRAVLDWTVVAGITSGPVFRRLLRGDRVSRNRLKAPSVALVIKQLAARVGLDPARYAGHSLRSGFLTSAARNRASIFKMADQSRHKSLDVLRAYVRNEERFDDHAAEGLLQQNTPARRAR